jgi:hypothetical protein
VCSNGHGQVNGVLDGDGQQADDEAASGAGYWDAGERHRERGRMARASMGDGHGVDDADQIARLVTSVCVTRTSYRPDLMNIR